MRHSRARWIKKQTSKNIPNSWKTPSLYPPKKSSLSHTAGEFYSPCLVFTTCVVLKSDRPTELEGLSIGVILTIPVMLRILHPTYQWGKSAEEREREKKEARQWFRFVLVPLSNKQTCETHSVHKINSSFTYCAVDVVLYSRLYPLRSGGKMQTRLRCSSSLVLFFSLARTHSQSDGIFFFFFFVIIKPRLTRREKGYAPGSWCI